MPLPKERQCQMVVPPTTRNRKVRGIWASTPPSAGASLPSPAPSSRGFALQGPRRQRRFRTGRIVLDPVNSLSAQPDLFGNRGNPYRRFPQHLPHLGEFAVAYNLAAGKVGAIVVGLASRVSMPARWAGSPTSRGLSRRCWLANGARNAVAKWRDGSNDATYVCGMR
jgi:hypothetical protein